MLIFCSILASIINTSHPDTEENIKIIEDSSSDSEYYETNNEHSERHAKRILDEITPAENIILTNIKNHLAEIEAIVNSLVTGTNNIIEYTEKINALISQFISLGECCSQIDQIYNGNIEILRQHFNIIQIYYNFDKYEREINNIINATIDINKKMEQIQQKMIFLILYKSSNTLIYKNIVLEFIRIRKNVIYEFCAFLCFQKNNLPSEVNDILYDDELLNSRAIVLQSYLQGLFNKNMSTYNILVIEPRAI